VGNVHRKTNIEQLLQSPASSSLAIRDLTIGLVKLRDADIVKLKSCLLVCEAVAYTIFIHTRTLY